MSYLKHCKATIKYCYGLYRLARERDNNFDVYNYEWHLGYNIVKKLNRESGFTSFERPTLYGINIVTDYMNPTTIKLYKDITNDL